MDAAVTQEELLASIKGLVNSYCERSFNWAFDPANPRVRLHEPTFGGEEIWEALESLLSTRVTMGEKVRRFEREFLEYFGFRNTLMVNSGSSANLLAISAITNVATSDRLRQGDEVIVPALAWSTTVWPLIQHGLVPVIVDIDPQTFNIDPNEVERAISDRTAGIMLVHVYGNPCDMSAIMDIVDRHSLTLVEDCCEALGAYFGDKPVGSFGRAGAFSFYFSHHITTLEGGMCVTGDDELGETMRILRAHGWVRETLGKDKYTAQHPTIDPGFLFVNLGYNLRATELQGGFGYVQLGELKRFVEIRTDNARFWQNRLEPFGEFFEFQKETAGATNSWFGFPMAIKNSAPFTARDLTGFMNTRHIEIRKS